MQEGSLVFTVIVQEGRKKARKGSHCLGDSTWSAILCIFGDREIVLVPVYSHHEQFLTLPELVLKCLARIYLSALNGIYIYIYARVKKSSIYITCRESILFWLRADCSLPPSIWGWADPTLCPFPHYNGLYVHTDVHTQIYTWHFCKISAFNCFKFQICTY